MEIGLWQFAQRPRRQHQLRIGMFWYHRIRALQFGQCDGGLTTLSPRGRRQMQTFRKLATHAPIANEKNAKLPK